MKCSFCGGDVIDGRCQDCGMPYATEKRYSLRSEGESVHTHDVNGEKVLHRVRKTPGKTPFYTCPPEKLAPQRPKGSYAARKEQENRRDSRRKIYRSVGWVILLVLLVELFPIFFASCSA